MDKKKYALVILAAGNSNRLGHPKQLVQWEKSTLLNYVIEQAFKVPEIDLYVTLGGNKDVIRDSIPSNVNVFYNPNWNEGMGESIAFSVSQVIAIHNFDAIIISVSDQPFITTNNYLSLITQFEKGKSSIIVSKYNSGKGPPTLFSSKHFHDLMQLKGDIGANGIVQANSMELDFVLFPKGNIDIDTKEDLKNLDEKNLL